MLATLYLITPLLFSRGLKCRKTVAVDVRCLQLKMALQIVLIKIMKKMLIKMEQQTDRDIEVITFNEHLFRKLKDINFSENSVLEYGLF